MATRYPLVLNGTQIQELQSGDSLTGLGLATVATTGSASDLTTGTLAKTRLPSGVILQVQSTLYTSTFTMASANNTRVPVTNFYVDITPTSASSKILVMADLAVGFAATPEWSWFIDRSIGGGGNVVVGNSGSYVGNRMYGYHGGPMDNGMANVTDDILSFSHNFVDSPLTTSSIRYQVCMQDRWSNGQASYINRSGNDSDTGYTTRGSSAIIVMEIAQ